MRVRSLVFNIVLVIVAEESRGAAGFHVLQSLDYCYFLAGGTCAAISHGITTPIDVVKTKIQDDPKKYDKGLIVTALDLIRSDGAGALMGGFGPTVVGYGIEGAVKFGLYEMTKPFFSDILRSTVHETQSTATIALLLASCVAGAIAALLLCPMEATRIKVVTDIRYKDLGLLDGLTKMREDEGVGSIFACFWAMLAKQVPYTLGKQVSFDSFAKALYQICRKIEDNCLPDVHIKWIVSIVSAILASLIACIFSQPGDMILTETCRHEMGEKHLAGQNHNFSHVIERLYQDGGISRFFKGSDARIVHVGTIVTCQLLIYDCVKQMLGLPATGA